MAAADTLHSFNAFLTERLTAAAVEIYGFVERTVVEYQEEVYRTQLENQRLQRLLDLVYKPEIRLHRAGMCLLLLPVTASRTPAHIAGRTKCSSSLLLLAAPS